MLWPKASDLVFSIDKSVKKVSVVIIGERDMSALVLLRGDTGGRASTLAKTVTGEPSSLQISDNGQLRLRRRFLRSTLVCSDFWHSLSIV